MVQFQDPKQPAREWRTKNIQLRVDWFQSSHCHPSVNTGRKFCVFLHLLLLSIKHTFSWRYTFSYYQACWNQTISLSGDTLIIAFQLPCSLFLNKDCCCVLADSTFSHKKTNKLMLKLLMLVADVFVQVWRCSVVGVGDL